MNMRKFLLILLSFTVVGFASAQSKVAYLYSGEIFEKHPKYIEAQAKIKSFIDEKQSEIDSKLESAKKLYSVYTNSQGRMNSSDAEEMKALIIQTEDEANELQEKIFDQGGELEQLQKQLIVPIENELVAAVNTIAQSEGYDLVFDLTIVKNTIYQSQKINITEQVKQALGI